VLKAPRSVLTRSSLVATICSSAGRGMLVVLLVVGSPEAQESEYMIRLVDVSSFESRHFGEREQREIQEEEEEEEQEKTIPKQPKKPTALPPSNRKPRGPTGKRNATHPKPIACPYQPERKNCHFRRSSRQRSANNKRRRSFPAPAPSLCNRIR
jgi:hypothetical protein